MKYLVLMKVFKFMQRMGILEPLPIIFGRTKKVRDISLKKKSKMNSSPKII